MHLEAALHHYLVLVFGTTCPLLVLLLSALQEVVFGTIYQPFPLILLSQVPLQ